jgi:hypothetical protein
VDEPTEPPSGHRLSYAAAIDQIVADVVKLAARTGEEVGAATQALLDDDLSLAERVSGDREELRRVGIDIEHRVFEVLALQSPMASDLRTLVTVLRIVQELDLTAGLMGPGACTPRNCRRGCVGSSSAWAPRLRSSFTSRPTPSPISRRRWHLRCRTWTT